MNEQTLGTIVVVGALVAFVVAVVVAFAPVIARAFTLPGW